MALTIEQLQAVFTKSDNTESRPSNYYRFWDMKFGETATVRFLPDANENNPLGFMVEKLMHNLTINGERRSVPCRKMVNEDCPICSVSTAFYKEEGDGSQNGKNYWRKKQHLVQALIIEDPLAPDATTGENSEGKVCYLNLGYQLYSVIKESLTSGDLDAIPFDYENGYDFIIKKTEGQGGNPKYDVGSKFSRRSTSLTEDEIAFVKDEMIDLSTLIPSAMDLDKMEAMLTASLTGEHYEDGNSSGGNATTASTTTESTPVVSAVESTPIVEVESTPVETQTETSAEYSEKGDAVLEMIRKRQQKSAE